MFFNKHEIDLVKIVHYLQQDTLCFSPHCLTGQEQLQGEERITEVTQKSHPHLTF